MNESSDSSKESSQSGKNVQVTSELSDNEDIIFELDECLQSKEATLIELRKEAEELENDIRMYTTPYNCENGTLEEDIVMFRAIASKYVKEELVEFYVDRMKKVAFREIKPGSSTISELCKQISSGKGNN